MEKIIFFIDIDVSMSSPVYSGKSRLDLVKQGLMIFLHTKAEISNVPHEYAVAALAERAVLLLDFTTDIEKIDLTVSNLQPVQEFGSFDMTSVFEVISSKIADRPPRRLRNGSYRHVVRSIFVYARPYLPTWGEAGETMLPIQKLMTSDFFFFDSLYFHVPHPDQERSREDVLHSFLVKLTAPNDFSAKCYQLKIPNLPDPELIASTFYDSFALLVANGFCRKDQNHQVAQLHGFKKKKGLGRLFRSRTTMI